MRKIALVLTVLLCIASVSFAAPAKKAAPAPAPEHSSGGISAVTLTAIGCPAVRFDMGSFALEAGGSIASPAAGQTNTTLILKGELGLSNPANNVNTYWAPMIMLQSAAGASTTTISVLLGAEYTFTPKLALFAEMAAFSLTSAAGATTWVLSANNGQIYTGGRLYL